MGVGQVEGVELQNNRRSLKPQRRQEQFRQLQTQRHGRARRPNDGTTAAAPTHTHVENLPAKSTHPLGAALLFLIFLVAGAVALAVAVVRHAHLVVAALALALAGIHQALHGLRALVDGLAHGVAAVAVVVDAARGVAQWVRGEIERRRSGREEAIGAQKQSGVNCAASVCE